MSAPPVAVDCVIEGGDVEVWPTGPVVTGPDVVTSQRLRFARPMEVAIEGVVMLPPRAGMTISATADALGKSLDALLDDLADTATGEFERLRTTTNTLVLTPLQWRCLLRVTRLPRPRRSRQVRGQRARCANRVALRSATRP